MASLTTDEWITEKIAKLKNPSTSSAKELEPDEMEVDDDFDGNDDGIDAYPDDEEVPIPSVHTHIFPSQRKYFLGKC